MAEKIEGRFWDQLLGLLEAGRVIPVVGQDLLTVKYNGSEELLYPLLARRLAEYLDVDLADLPVPLKEIPPGKSINAVACSYIQKGNAVDDIYFGLKEMMPVDAELSIPTPLKKLAEITDITLFVTTTFDSLLERAINEAQFSGSNGTTVYSYNNSSKADLERPLQELRIPTVFHLFGKMSIVPDYAVTAEDTLEFLHSLHSESRQPKLLFDELNNNSLLILGCSFGDWLARFFLRAPKRRRLSEARGGKIIVADDMMRNDESLVFFLNSFSKKTKIYPSGGGAEFVDELHRRWKERRPKIDPAAAAVSQAPPKSNGGAKEGAVFVSYAHEDRDAALKIKDGLEGQGVDVYFDMDRYRGGDVVDDRIPRDIDACSIFLPLISENAIKKPKRWLMKEWRLAISAAEMVNPSFRFIVPVVIDETLQKDQRIPSEFQILIWEKLPLGQPNPDFLSHVRDEFRKYQKQIHLG